MVNQSDLKVRAKPVLFKQTGSCFDTTNIQSIKARSPRIAVRRARRETMSEPSRVPP
jgi:hypothetical protein